MKTAIIMLAAVFALKPQASTFGEFRKRIELLSLGQARVKLARGPLLNWRKVLSFTHENCPFAKHRPI